VGTVLVMPRLCVLFHGIYLRTEKICTEKLHQVSRKVPVGHDSLCRYGRLLPVARTSCRSRSPCSRGPGSTLGQSRYLPRCV